MVSYSLRLTSLAFLEPPVLLEPQHHPIRATSFSFSAWPLPRCHFEYLLLLRNHNFSNMRLQLDSYGKIKNYIHAAQGGILALAIVLTIAIFTRPGQNTGQVGWYFGLVR